MSVDPSEPVVTTLVCFFNLHARLRVQLAPGIPCALCLSRDIVLQSSGASRRGNAELYLDLTSLRGAQRRSNPLFYICGANNGLLRGACHRARVRATRWLAMTVLAAVHLIRHARACRGHPRVIFLGAARRGWPRQ